MTDQTEQLKESGAGRGPKVPRHRSPNYPAFSLRKAVERAKEVYDAYKQVQVPIKTIHTKWNYEQMSGVVLQTVAALKAYGLIEVSGDKDARLIRLTDAAVKIIREHPDRQPLLKEAALSPSVYAELWERYKADGVPPDDILAHCLEWDMHFNINAIGGFIADFRDTIAFANLMPTGTIGDGGNSGDVHPEGGGDEPPKKRTAQMQPPKGLELPEGGPNMRTDTFILEEGPAVALQYPGTWSQSSYEDFKDWMEIELRKIKRLIKADSDDNQAKETQ